MGRRTPPLVPPPRRGYTPAEARVKDQLADGVRPYEHRFGRPLLIRTSGHSPAELLVQLWNRLGNDPDTEDLVIAQQLRQIALLELTTKITD